MSDFKPAYQYGVANAVQKKGNATRKKWTFRKTLSASKLSQAK